MPPPSLTLAKVACDLARICCDLKSDNKWNPGMSKEKPGKPSVDRTMRQGEAYQAITKLRKEHPTTDGDLTSLADRASAAIDAGAGNCFELSAIAFAILAAQSVKPLEIVGVSEPGDHVFVVLGLGRPVGEVDPDMTTWGQDVFISDPWAHIYTRAKLYDNWWRLRMGSWANKGKKVSHKGKWDLPTQEIWFTSINKGKKRVKYVLN